MAKKNQSLYTCQKCFYQTLKWLGKCPQCHSWNSFAEEIKTANTSKYQGKSENNKNSAKKIDQIVIDQFSRYQTGLSELDRVLGGGLVKGSLTLIGGGPGIGKSTLLLDVTARLARKFEQEAFLYVSAEESESQVAQRCKRLGVNADNFFIMHESDLQNIINELKKVRPKFIVLDSIQTLVSKNLDSPPGTISQVREITYEMMNFCKANDITCFIIGHITKDGMIAGPKVLEHMVDTVVYFEGDQYGHYRLLRGIKNRFGNTNEVGIFEMNEEGLAEVANPSLYFLEHNDESSYGRSISSILEGSRTLLVEIQALVVENKYGTGRRTTQGIDPNRLAMLVAVIEKYFGIPLGLNDIYVNVTGGIKIQGREVDLSIMASLLSSLRGVPILPVGTVFIGEVGLTGEVRPTPLIDMRIAEIAQLNYQRVITSKQNLRSIKNFSGLEIIGISKASELEPILF